MISTAFPNLTSDVVFPCHIFWIVVYLSYQIYFLFSLCFLIQTYILLKSRFELIWMIDPILPMVKSVRCQYFCSQTYSNKKKNHLFGCGLWLAELVYRAFWLASRNLKGWALMMSSYKASWCRCVHPISLTVLLWGVGLIESFRFWLWQDGSQTTALRGLLRHWQSARWRYVCETLFHNILLV